MTTRGKFILTLLILGVAALGGYKWRDQLMPDAASSSTGASVSTNAPAAAKPGALDPADFVAPHPACPLRPPAGTYIPKDNIVDLELSEYAGYSGIVVANGGVEPTENSFFFRKHGFKVRIKLSEEESWPALNTGRIAG